MCEQCQHFLWKFCNSGGLFWKFKLSGERIQLRERIVNFLRRQHHLGNVPSHVRLCLERDRLQQRLLRQRLRDCDNPKYLQQPDRLPLEWCLLYSVRSYELFELHRHLPMQ